MSLLPLESVDPLDEAALGVSPDDLADPSEEEETYLAVLATSWSPRLVFEAKPDRYSLNLPEGAIKLGLVPDRGEPFVLFGISNEIQIWHGSHWSDRVRKAARNLEQHRNSFSR